MWSAASCWARRTLMMHFSVDLMAHFINESQRMYCTESNFVFAVVKCLFIRLLHGPFIHCFHGSQAQIDLKSNISYYIVWSNYFIHNNWIALNLKVNEPFHQFRGSKFSAHKNKNLFFKTESHWNQVQVITAVAVVIVVDRSFSMVSRHRCGKFYCCAKSYRSIPDWRNFAQKYRWNAIEWSVWRTSRYYWLNSTISC